MLTNMIISEFLLRKLMNFFFFFLIYGDRKSEFDFILYLVLINFTAIEQIFLKQVRFLLLLFLLLINGYNL